MRVLLTGVSGQVGCALLPRLAAGHNVVAADRAMLDLSQPDQIAAVLDRLAPDLIVNPAAYTAVDRAEDDCEQAIVINEHAPRALANWALARDVPLVHFSTDYVFGGEGERPWREDDAIRPLSVYGASKLAGEAAIRAVGGSHLIVRSSWVYAAQGRNFLRTIARLARERQELKVVDDQFGAPTPVAVIAEAVAAMLAGGLEPFRRNCAQAHGVIHLAASGETSWHGFATAIVDGLKARGVPLAVERVQPIRSKDYPTRAARPRNSRLDLTRLRQVFGIDPPSWLEGLAPELDRLARELAGQG